MKKGLSLPINMIVVVGIAVLVLVVVAAYFGRWFIVNTETIDLQTAFDKGCSQLKTSYNCDPDKVDDIYIQFQQQGDSQPKKYIFGGICNIKLGYESRISDENEISENPESCAKACGCW